MTKLVPERGCSPVDIHSVDRPRLQAWPYNFPVNHHDATSFKIGQRSRSGNKSLELVWQKRLWPDYFDCVTAFLRALASRIIFADGWLPLSIFCVNGQMMSGPYKKLVIIASNAWPVTFQFTDTTNATLTLPSGRQVAITRRRV